MLRPLLPAALALLLSLSGVAAETEVRVSASILPVHGLVAAVMKGVGEPDLILPPGASPHGYALKPSGATAMSRADVIFRIGPALEAFLDRPLANLSGSATRVDLVNAPGLLLLPIRDNDAFADDGHGHGQGHHEDDDGDEDHDANGHDDHDEDHAGMIDPHFWLDPLNAIAMVRHVAEVLSVADAANAARYRDNAVATISRLEDMQTRIAARLQPVQGRPFIVFHDAFQYFENKFGLTAVGSITINPEVSPGARQISLIQDRIHNDGVRCVLADPQFNSAIVESLANNNHVLIGIIDPIGPMAGTTPDPFVSMMEQVASVMLACLGDGD